MEPRKRANVLVFDGQWKVVVENNHPSKTSKRACFQGVGRWWWWRTAIAPENEQTCSFSMACGKWWQWRTITALENEQMCSFPRGWKVLINIFT